MRMDDLCVVEGPVTRIEEIKKRVRLYFRPERGDIPWYSPDGYVGEICVDPFVPAKDVNIGDTVRACLHYTQNAQHLKLPFPVVEDGKIRYYEGEIFQQPYQEPEMRRFPKHIFAPMPQLGESEWAPVVENGVGNYPVLSLSKIEKDYLFGPPTSIEWNELRGARISRAVSGGLYNNGKVFGNTLIELNLLSYRISNDRSFVIGEECAGRGSYLPFAEGWTGTVLGNFKNYKPTRKFSGLERGNMVEVMLPVEDPLVKRPILKGEKDGTINVVGLTKIKVVPLIETPTMPAYLPFREEYGFEAALGRLPIEAKTDEEHSLQGRVLKFLKSDPSHIPRLYESFGHDYGSSNGFKEAKVLHRLRDPEALSALKEVNKRLKKNEMRKEETKNWAPEYRFTEEHQRMLELTREMIVNLSCGDKPEDLHW